MPQHPTVSVVIVSFDSTDAVAAAESVPDWAELVLVEQHALSEVPQAVIRLRPSATIIRSGANRGFGAGCNLGAANASGDVLVFLNPDATLDPQSLLAMARATGGDDVGVVGPTIVDGGGAADTRARNWSRGWNDAFHLLWPERWTPTPWMRDIPPEDDRYRTGGVVPYVQGSCMTVRRDVFFAVHGFDERFFLYGEEEDLAYRLQEIGRKTLLLASAVAQHLGATSTDRVPTFGVEQLFRSHVLLYRKHISRAAAWRGAALLSAALLVLIATAPVRRVVGVRRRESVTWCRAGLRGVRAGLFARSVTPPPVEAGRQWPSSDTGTAPSSRDHHLDLI